jgi:hypothetical protein
MRHCVRRLLAVLLLLPGLGIVALDHAAAGQCRSIDTPVQSNGGGLVTYNRKQVCPAGVTPSNAPLAGGVKVSPSCDVKGSPPATFCWGSRLCLYIPSGFPFIRRRRRRRLLGRSGTSESVTGWTLVSTGRPRIGVLGLTLK